MNKIRSTPVAVILLASDVVIMLEDIAILTGGTVITEDLGLELKDATIETGAWVKQRGQQLWTKIALLS